ncbi:MAG: peptide chain release factor N(5)-glutamine methyltransferase [Chloroflexi bacterium]|nr:peptide chain release factor N(5)-glutamine methyltransferase [Chloroflexota bacterium]
MTAGQWLRKYTSIFQQAGIEEAGDEARVLLCHALKLNKAGLFAQPERIMAADEIALLEGLAERRLRREPAAYIVQNKEFYDLDLFVDPRVLIPRPETEILVEEAVKFGRAWIERNKKTISIADVGTGCGAIAIALALHLPGSLVYAVDISAAALEVAALNIEKYKISDRVIMVQGDLLQQINAGVDIITANLPYIPQNGMRLLQPEIANYEPEEALQGGENGIEVIGRLLEQVPGKINRNGAVFLEIGEGQEEEIIPVISRCLPGPKVTLIKDLAGINRVIKIEAKRLLTNI